MLELGDFVEVTIRPFKDYDYNVNTEMYEYNGKTAQIVDVINADRGVYKLSFGDCEWRWSADMLTPIPRTNQTPTEPEPDIKPLYKIITSGTEYDLIYLLNDFLSESPDYVIVKDSGIVINSNNYVILKLENLYEYSTIEDR